MSDVIDEIISKLSPEVLTTLEKYEPEDASPKDYNQKLENTMKEYESIRINRQIRDVRNDTKNLESKTKENKLKLVKYQKELEGLKELMKTPENVQKNDRYDQMIQKMQEQLFILKKDANDPNPLNLVQDVYKLHGEITENKKTISKLEKKMEHCEGLPPNIFEAKNVIAEMKEKIQDKELKVEKSMFMSM